MQRLLCAVLIAFVALAGHARAQIYTLKHAFENPTLEIGGQFGISVAQVGDKVLVGAPGNNTGASGSGAAYLYDGATGALLQTYTKPGTKGANDRFGIWVAAADDNVLIGGSGINGGGEAYLFDTDGNLLQTFENPNPVANSDQFGAVVAWVDGKAVIGAPAYSSSSGRVHVFNGSSAMLVQTIENPTPASGDQFGSAIAGLGNNILVSAILDDNAKGTNAGVVYLIDPATGALVAPPILSPSAVTPAQDRFGWSIAANNNYILIGAVQSESGATPSAGSAFLFDATTLDLLYELPDPSPGSFQAYGAAVAFTDDHALIGAPAGNGNAGEVHVFDPATGAHLPPTLSDPFPNNSELFGWRVAAAGNSVVVGAYQEGITEQNGYGAAYLFSSNAPPVADAGEDQAVECSSPSGTPVTLDGSGTVDPDGDELTYTWRENGNIIAGPTSDATAQVVLALGSHTIELTADDGNGGTDTDEVVVNVEDTTPPVIALQPAITLWPPNHKYTTVTIAQAVASVSDACTGDIPLSGVKIALVTSDEPENAPDVVCNIDDPLHVCYNGDGSTTNDIVIAGDCGSVQLRKERAASGNGRVYTIHVEVSDEHGNVGTAAFKVSVPHDQSGDPAVENVECYTVEGGCGMSKLAGGNGSTSDEAIPAGYAIFQNYPNPFNPETEIRFQLPEASHVTVKILTTLGENVRTLAAGEFSAGTHSVRWNAQNEHGATVPSGVYFYQVITPRFNAIRRMILIK